MSEKLEDIITDVQRLKGIADALFLACLGADQVHNLDSLQWLARDVTNLASDVADRLCAADQARARELAGEEAS